MESFLRGHVNAFRCFQARQELHSTINLKSACWSGTASQIHFNPRLLELAAHYHFVPRPCKCGPGIKKGRVERAIRMCAIRSGQPAPSPRWRSAIARRSSGATRWRINVPGRTIAIALFAQAFIDEQPRLLPLPLHPFSTDCVIAVRAAKTIYVRFDGNDTRFRPRLSAVRSCWRHPIPSARPRRREEIARHRRSYNRQQLVLDPAHQQACCAASARRVNPHAQAIWNWPFRERGPAGASLRRRRIGRAPERATARAARSLRNTSDATRRPRGSGAQTRRALLRSRSCCVSAMGAMPLPLDLSRHPQAQNLEVRPHDLETYDELAHRRDEEPES